MMINVVMIVVCIIAFLIATSCMYNNYWSGSPMPFWLNTILIIFYIGTAFAIPYFASNIYNMR